MKEAQTQEHWARDIREALLNDDIQIAVQPKFCLSSYQKKGEEILLRWTHPLHGFIRTDYWIRLAQNNGLIPELNRWLLQKAFSLMEEGRQDLSWPLAVNIPPDSLDVEFIQWIHGELERRNLDPALLEIEVTESSFVDTLFPLAKCLRTLRDKGVCVSLDDFGTGYSSMRYLAELEVDKIKIDKTFVHKALSSQTTFFVLRKMVDLGKEINLTIVCEGIETTDHLHLVRSLGVCEGQGYFFERPRLLSLVSPKKNQINRSFA